MFKSSSNKTVSSTFSPEEMKRRMRFWEAWCHKFSILDLCLGCLNKLTKLKIGIPLTEMNVKDIVGSL